MEHGVEGVLAAVPTAADLGKLLYFRLMASITLSVPDELAAQIRAQQRQLPRILELGLRELNAGGNALHGMVTYWVFVL